MDQDVRALERSFEQDPGDEATARRLTAALTREGETAKVDALYRWKLECPLRWGQLAGTATPGVRFCGECQRSVHAVEDLGVLAAHVRAGDCVAVPASLLDAAFGRIASDPAQHPARSAGDPCVVPGGFAGSLAGREIPEAVLGLIGPRAARRYRVLPLEVRADTGRLVVAVTATTDLANVPAPNHELEPVLVPAEELAAAIDRHYAERMRLGMVLPDQRL